MKKPILFIAGAILASAFLWQAGQRILFSAKDGSNRRGEGAVGVQIAAVEKRTIQDVGLFTGTLHPRSQYIVAPKIAGRLDKLFVNIGDRVKRGQLIAQLENDEYMKQVDQARAELEVARANLEESRSNLAMARREFDRARVLREKKIASESELDAADAHLKAQDAKHRVAQAQFAQREAALKTAQVRLSYTVIYAGWEEGDEQRVVGERFVDEGAMLAANTSIASILDIGSLVAVIHVIERDYPKISLGQVASLAADAFPDRVFTGKVLRMAPLVKETSRQARVEIEVPNREGVLRPGMFVRIRIAFASKENATVVPLNSLVIRDGRQGVFLADLQAMKAHFVGLTTGLVSGEWVEVMEPPLSGQVVTLGQHLLVDGKKIVLPNHTPKAAQGEQTRDPRFSKGKP